MWYYKNMSRIIAALFLIVFVWFAIPHAKNGEWFAPTILPPYHWIYNHNPKYKTSLSPIEDGYAMYSFDFWNDKNISIRSVTNDDLVFKKIW